MSQWKSGSMRLYSKSSSQRTQEHMAKISDADKAKLDEWYAWAEANYSKGGHWIVESYEPWELLKSCQTLRDVQELCGLIEDKAQDARNA